MNSYGIKGPLIKWFEHYLYQRKQKVINRATSSTVVKDNLKWFGNFFWGYFEHFLADFVRTGRFF
jgi:hypothetical protein